MAAMKKSNYERSELNKKRVASAIEAGSVLKFSDLLIYITPTPVAQQAGIIFKTWKRRVGNPGTFAASEIAALADVLGIAPELLLKLILAETDFTPKETKKEKEG